MKCEKVDTIRLRVLHTKCMTVSEIASEMGITFSAVEYELKKMGYTPIYDREVPERCPYIQKK